MAGRTYRTEAVVLRSIRLGEADRVLHLYTLERGQDRGGREGDQADEVALRRPARAALARRGDAPPGWGRPADGDRRAARSARTTRCARIGYRLGVGLVGAEAMLRLFGEPEANPRAFEALTQASSTAPTSYWTRAPGRPALLPLASLLPAQAPGCRVILLQSPLPAARRGRADELVARCPRQE